MTHTETVVLVNGLWMPNLALWPLQRRLRAQGFDVRRFHYRTVADDLHANATRLNAFLREIQADTIHLVGYSLGGIVIRALFHFYPEQRPGRIVTLAVPHGGSHAARQVARHAWARPLLGKSVANLIAEEPQVWAFPPRELGTIAGNLAVGLGRAFGGLEKPHDGTVRVVEACPDTATDRLILPVSHFSILFAPAVAVAVARFLRAGSFQSTIDAVSS